jgi:hypothetical protein
MVFSPGTDKISSRAESEEPDQKIASTLPDTALSTKYDAQALLNDLVAELTLSILSLELQIELDLKEDPSVVPILQDAAMAHISVREVTMRALNSLESLKKASQVS